MMPNVFSRRRLWIVVLLVLGLSVFAFLAFSLSQERTQRVEPPLLKGTPTTYTVATARQAPGLATPSPRTTPLAPYGLVTPVQYALPTAAVGDFVVDLPAVPKRVGWTSREVSGIAKSSMPDFTIYAGTFQDTTYLGVVGFDLSSLDAYGPAKAAELLLFGLTANNQLLTSGNWRIEILADDRGFWQAPSFDTLTAAPAGGQIGVLNPTDLAFNQIVRLSLGSDAIAAVNSLRYQTKSLTLRLRGPDEDSSLFGFDGGVGRSSLGNPPRLLVSAGPAQPTATPIFVTVTPTPENVLTAAAHVLTVTAARTIGAAGLVPPNYMIVTPGVSHAPRFWIDPAGTPLPIIIPLSTPANQATTDVQARLATAVALTTGTPTPLPARYVTATPSLTPIHVLATPTPENVMTLAARIISATTEAHTLGTATPLPPNVVVSTPTPLFVVIVPTATAVNQATAQAATLRAIAVATAVAMTTGTYTPQPLNLATVTWTPNPTPLPLLFYEDQMTPRPSPTVTPTPPSSMPAIMQGKILFKSDRDGASATYALDVPSGRVALVTHGGLDGLAAKAEPFSPDGHYRAFVRNADTEVRNRITGAKERISSPQIFIQDIEFKAERQVTAGTSSSYDPAWSPQGDRIVFVSTEPGNDEIYVMSTDGSDVHRLTVNTWEWDKHPTWSPDGSQIVFYSNRDTGRRQLWIMNVDGSNQRLLLSSLYNDWDPIWVK